MKRSENIDFAQWCIMLAFTIVTAFYVYFMHSPIAKIAKLITYALWTALTLAQIYLAISFHKLPKTEREEAYFSAGTHPYFRAVIYILSIGILLVLFKDV